MKENSSIALQFDLGEVVIGVSYTFTAETIPASDALLS